MKIQQIKVNFVRLPEEEPLVGAPHMIGMLREFFTVRVETDHGIEGIGVTTFGGKLARSLRAALEDFGELIKGEDPLRVEHVNAKMRAASAPCGSGIAMLAISAIDTALWDIRGKTLNLPLAQLLGGARDKVPAYASGALSRTTPTDKLQRAASALVEKGYRQIKTQMAVEGLNPKQEIERIRLVREAVGPDVNLMVDINQRWSVADLRRRISLGHRTAPAGDDASRQRHHHDRFGTGRRRHAVDEGGRHGGGLQQARRQPFASRDSRAPDCRHPERAGRRIHAVDLAAVRESADAGQRRNRRAVGRGARTEIRAGSIRQIRRRLGELAAAEHSVHIAR